MESKLIFRRTLLGITVSALCALSASAYSASLQSNEALQAANIGFAMENGGTTGGADAASANIYLVSDVASFKAALKEDKGEPRIVQISGTIDISGGTDYTSESDQKKRSQIKIPSDTTIIGVTDDAGFTNGSLVIRKVENVIVRNISIETPVDVEPHYESGDGWNAEWDSMTITYSTNVWVDHVTFDDGSFTDADYKEVDGEEYVQHDGELDIKHGSDYVTVSYSVFKNHNKTMLIGHSKSNSKEDSGHLRVTLADNIFNTIVQRTPRVRFGKIHVFNNLFVGDYDDDTYPYMYSFGLGYKGSIFSEKNVFNIDNLKSSKKCKIVSVKKSNSSLLDSGSTFNGSAMSFDDCDIPSDNLSWSVPYSYTLISTSKLAKTLNSEAGAGNLSL